MASQPRDDHAATDQDVTAGAPGGPAGFDEQGESLDERGLGSAPTPANPLSPDAGLTSAGDAPAAPGAEAEAAERAVARRTRQEAEADEQAEEGAEGTADEQADAEAAGQS